MSKLLETWYEVEGPVCMEDFHNYRRACDRAREFAKILNFDVVVYECCVDGTRNAIAVIHPNAAKGNPNAN